MKLSSPANEIHILNNVHYWNTADYFEIPEKSNILPPKNNKSYILKLIRIYKNYMKHYHLSPVKNYKDLLDGKEYYDKKGHIIVNYRQPFLLLCY